MEGRARDEGEARSGLGPFLRKKIEFWGKGKIDLLFDEALLIPPRLEVGLKWRVGGGGKRDGA